jgi:hypothetical protein
MKVGSVLLLIRVGTRGVRNCREQNDHWDSEVSEDNAGGVGQESIGWPIAGISRVNRQPPLESRYLLDTYSNEVLVSYLLHQ